MGTTDQHRPKRKKGRRKYDKKPPGDPPHAHTAKGAGREQCGGGYRVVKKRLTKID